MWRMRSLPWLWLWLWNGDFAFVRDDWNGEEDSSSKRRESQRVRVSVLSSYSVLSAQTRRRRALSVFEAGTEAEEVGH